VPKVVNDNAEVDVDNVYDTTIAIISPNPTDFTNSANKILQDINKQFTNNLLSLNADET
jgi:F420-0:gamma-glutamyl ligase